MLFTQTLLLAVASVFPAVVAVWPALDAEESPRILGGEDADIEDYPYTVSIFFKKKFVCGGVILAEKKVLTSAQCTKMSANPRDFKVRAGSTFRHKGGRLIRAKQISENPMFNGSTFFDYDDSVLTLKKRIVFGSKAQPVRLAPADGDVPVGTTGNVTGWGANGARVPANYPKRLQALEVPRYDDVECNAFLESLNVSLSLTPRMACYGYVGLGKGCWECDQGNPLVVDGELHGIYSSVLLNVGASPSHPQLYTKISDPEIRKHIDSCL